ncbi:MAG: translation initiation factor IF-2 [Candidatus Woesearchaeota archaeon]
MIRKPIVTIMGHVDHGKTKILDTIRKSTVAEREAGAITQAIGASIVPLETIERLCGNLLKKINMKITLPGLLFIDTPGHAAFSNLRKRGGNLADIAILVIDINDGLKPQTLEAIEILKKYKTPFVIALNKVDLVSGWKTTSDTLIENINSLSEQVKSLLDQKMYEIVGKLFELNLQAERFDRITDHTKQIAIVPTCAKTGEGIPELLMLLTGLAQKFLNTCLECDTKGAGKGTIIEVKEEQGIGKTLDTIIYNGSIKIGDTIIIGGINKTIETKVRCLFEPAALSEIRDKKNNFKSIKSASAAIGVKIGAPNLEEVFSGMPIMVANKENIEKIKKEILNAVNEVIIETDKDGIILKADSLGSLEALVTLLKEKNIPIRKASVGDITKKDITDAKSNLKENHLNAVILGFNVKIVKDAIEYKETSNVVVWTNQVIYRLLEDYEQWKNNEEEKIKKAEIEKLPKPFKIEILKGMVFRQNNPAVVGVEVLDGLLKQKSNFMKNDGVKLGFIKSIQHEQDNLKKAEKGKQVAVSIDNVTVGRQIHEGDILYSDLTELEFRLLKEYKKHLSNEEIEMLKEIAEIKRKNNHLWGI